MNGATILVVDDNSTNRKLVSDVLGFDGYRILEAGDAEVAQEIVRKTPPDLILMDIALPGMDGLTLTWLLKASDATRDIHIVAVTSYPEKFSREEALEAGCDAYLGKPLSTRTLPATLIDVVKNAGSLDR